MKPVKEGYRIAVVGGVVNDSEIDEAELDFTFLATQLKELPAFLESWHSKGAAARSLLIDVVGDGSFGEASGRQIVETAAASRVGIPFLDHRFPIAGVHADAARVH